MGKLSGRALWDSSVVVLHSTLDSFAFCTLELLSHIALILHSHDTLICFVPFCSLAKENGCLLSQLSNTRYQSENRTTITCELGSVHLPFQIIVL